MATHRMHVATPRMGAAHLGRISRRSPFTPAFQINTSPSRAAHKRLNLFFALGVLVIAAMVQPYRFVYVSGHSMAPAIRPGEILLETRSWSTLHRGDIVTAQVGTQSIIKRVAYLPGDRVAICGNPGNWVILPNSWATPERVASLERRLIHEHALTTAGYLTVPPNHAYLLGDNTNGSIDSRNFGPVPLGAIRGKIIDAPAKVDQSHLSLQQESMLYSSNEY